MDDREFRDWARRQQGDFNDRLKALERRFQEMNLSPPRLRDPDVGYDVKELYERLGEHVKAGRVTGLAFAIVTVDEGPLTGFAHEVWERPALAGVAGQLWFELLTRPVTEDAQENVHAQVDGRKMGEGVSHAG